MFQWLIELLQELQKQGPLEQFTYVFAALSAVVTAALAYRSLVRRGFAETQEKCEKLTAEIGAYQDRIRRRDAQIAEHERMIAALRARVPEFQLELADKERLESNETKTIRILTDLFADIRPGVSSCCFQLAECHLSMFIDDVATPHLHTAGRLARIAALLDPERQDARELLTEIEAILGDSDSRLGDYPTSDAHWDIALDYVGGPRTGRGAALLEVVRERAYALYQEGQYYTSGIFYRRAVLLAAEQLGPDHPSTFTMRNNLALLYRDMGRYQEAETLFEEVLAKQEQKLGHDHPDTLTTRNNLAALYQDMGRREEAETLYKEVLAKQEQLGPDHPDTLRTRNNLAMLYRDMGRYEEAETLKEVLAKLEQKLGPDHPDTLRTRHNLAVHHQFMGRYQEAETLFKEVLAKQEQKLGPDHPHTLMTRHNLAALYRDMGRREEAETLFKEVLAKQEQKLGPDHPHTLMTRRILAVLNQDMGRYDEEAETLKEVLVKQEQKLGPDHPDTLMTRRNLAALYQLMGRREEAETLFKEVLAKQEQKLGPDHPHTLTTRAALEKLRAGRDGSGGGELPDERALTEAEAPDLVARPFEVETPPVAQLAEEPAPGGPEGPPPAAC